MTDLGTLGGDNSGDLSMGINNHGQIVGQSDTSSGKAHAFLWEDGTMTDLGTLGGDNSGALFINNRSQIVGWERHQLRPFHALFYGKMAP